MLRAIRMFSYATTHHTQPNPTVQMFSSSNQCGLLKLGCPILLLVVVAKLCAPCVQSPRPCCVCPHALGSPLPFPTDFTGCPAQAWLRTTIKGQLRDHRQEWERHAPQNGDRLPDMGQRSLGSCQWKQAFWVFWELHFLLNEGLLAPCWLWDYTPVLQGYVWGIM